MKALFLLKKNSAYGSYVGTRSGLYNSANILATELSKYLHIKTKVEICVDGNSIDREIHQYRPDLCIVEAIWVTPAKFKELIRLHPRVKFIVRIHSELSFLANEGVAFDYINEYSDLGITVGVNSLETLKELKTLYPKIAYLPNVYEHISLLKDDFSKIAKKIVQYSTDINGWRKLTWGKINIGCFGAIRPMKNHLFQAVAAIRYADKANVILHFHVNAGRTEQNGEAVLKNLRAIFEHTKHKLIEHPWMKRDEFLKVVASMDLGLQVSFTESFNIVTADFVKQGVPIIVSDAVRWCPQIAKVSTIDSDDLVGKIGQALKYRKLFKSSEKLALWFYNYNALNAWSKFLN